MRDGVFAFTNGSDGPLSRTRGPGTHVSLSLHPVTLRPEDVIQLLDLVSVPVCDGSIFCSLSDHSLLRTPLLDGILNA